VAVHDTVQTVLRDPAFQRTLRNSIADRFLVWLVPWFDRFMRALRHLPSARLIVLALVALLVVFVLARVVIAARSRGERVETRGWRRGAMATDNPWQLAEALAAEGRYEDAAHTLYRAVIASLARDERIQLDPSKTSGDYTRELRRRGAASLAPFRAFTRRFDVAVYGHRACDGPVFAELRELSSPFRDRTKAA
jgi:hypothetical protein